jgi:lactate dehydrogenase-like 2-hydroxyacid dehydrogenase
MDLSKLPARDGPFPHPHPKGIHLLVTRDVGAQLRATLEDAYTVHNQFDPDQRRRYIEANGELFEVVVTSGLIGLSDAEMACLPNLKIIHTFASGYEMVDLATARRRGIMVAHMPGTPAPTVGEHAIGMMIALTRGFVENDRAAREIHWDECVREWPTFSGKRLGILGYGNIGRETAKRAAGFDVDIGYHGRSEQKAVPHRYFRATGELADWADYLLVSLPASDATRHIIDDKVLKRLGPSGYLINVARGSVVDTQALDRALKDGIIAGAALDVVEGDPEIPTSLLGAPNLLLSPHIAGKSPEGAALKLGIIRANIENHLTGGKVLSPVAEMAEGE